MIIFTIHYLRIKIMKNFYRKWIFRSEIMNYIRTLKKYKIEFSFQ